MPWFIDQKESTTKPGSVEFKSKIALKFHTDPISQLLFKVLILEVGGFPSTCINPHFQFMH